MTLEFLYQVKSWLDIILGIFYNIEKTKIKKKFFFYSLVSLYHKTLGVGICF